MYMILLIFIIILLLQRICISFCFESRSWWRDIKPMIIDIKTVTNIIFPKIKLRRKYHLGPSFLFYKIGNFIHNLNTHRVYMDNEKLKKKGREYNTSNKQLSSKVQTVRILISFINNLWWITKYLGYLILKMKATQMSVTLIYGIDITIYT